VGLAVIKLDLIGRAILGESANHVHIAVLINSGDSIANGNRQFRPTIPAQRNRFVDRNVRNNGLLTLRVGNVSPNEKNLLFDTSGGCAEASRTRHWFDGSPSVVLDIER